MAVSGEAVCSWCTISPDARHPRLRLGTRPGPPPNATPLDRGARMTKTRQQESVTIQQDLVGDRRPLAD